jgi:nucleoside phosphorylase
VIDRALLLAPMSSELRPLVRPIGARRLRGTHGLSAHLGLVDQIEAVAVRIGIGPERAESVTARAILEYRPDHVILCGIAGGIDPELGVGAPVAPAEVLEVSTGELFRSSPLDGSEIGGVIGTTDHLVTEVEELASLRERGVVAVDMESSGVARACLAAGVPWTVFRVVSDRPDDELTGDWVMSLLKEDGSSDPLGALRSALANPRRLPAMAKLGRDASRAASLAAQLAVEALRRQS